MSLMKITYSNCDAWSLKRCFMEYEELFIKRHKNEIMGIERKEQYFDLY